MNTIKKIGFLAVLYLACAFLGTEFNVMQWHWLNKIVFISIGFLILRDPIVPINNTDQFEEDE